MSNNFQPNPHVVDTVMTNSLMQSTPRRPAEGPLFLVSVYWLNPVNVGDTFVIVDENGDTIKTGRCETANQSQEFDLHGLEVSDYKVTTLGSGSLYIQRATKGQLQST